MCKTVIETYLKVLSICCAVATVVLVVAWTHNGTGYLGYWQQSLLVWHPVLIVGGFFIAHTLAILTWSWPVNVERTRKLPKAVHLLWLFWELAALILMCFSLVTIYKYKSKRDEKHLTTMHSWIGVVTSGAFAINLLIAILSDCIEFLIKQCSLSITYQHSMSKVLHNTQKILELTVYGFTSVSISTGIASFQGNTCTTSSKLPMGCWISNSLGLSVMMTTVLVIVIAACRQLSSHHTVSSSDLESSLLAQSVLGHEDEWIYSTLPSAPPEPTTPTTLMDNMKE